jgi:hypothetical protein
LAAPGRGAAENLQLPFIGSVMTWDGRAILIDSAALLQCFLHCCKPPTDYSLKILYNVSGLSSRTIGGVKDHCANWQSLSEKQPLPFFAPQSHIVGSTIAADHTLPHLLQVYSLVNWPADAIYVTHSGMRGTLVRVEELSYETEDDGVAAVCWSGCCRCAGPGFRPELFRTSSHITGSHLEGDFAVRHLEILGRDGQR